MSMLFYSYFVLSQSFRLTVLMYSLGDTCFIYVTYFYMLCLLATSACISHFVPETQQMTEINELHTIIDSSTKLPANGTLSMACCKVAPPGI